MTLFIRTEHCTDWCGRSMFEDWLHTPACETAQQAALDAYEGEWIDVAPDVTTISTREYMDRMVTEEFCFLCHRATDHRGEH